MKAKASRIFSGRRSALLIRVGLLILISYQTHAQGVEDLISGFENARKIAKISADLAKQLDKVKSQYQYDQVVKNIPTANLGFFMAGEFKYAGLKDSKTKGKGSSMLAPKNHFGSMTSVETEEDLSAESSPFLDHLGWQLGLELIGKGGKYDDGNFSSKMSLIYLQLPIDALYFYDLPSGNRLYVGLGPYFAYGISGKVKESQSSFDAFKKSSNFIKRFDAGLSLTAGYWVTDRIEVSLKYDLGLANLSRDSQYETLKNRAFGINLGYALK